MTDFAVYKHDLALEEAFGGANHGTIKADTMFLPYLLQTAQEGVNSFLNLFRALANCVRLRHAKATREAELTH